jgi:hypothetical protein
MVSSSFGGVALGNSQPAPPCEDTSRLGCPALVLGQTRVPLGARAACPCPRQEAGPRPHVGTPVAKVVCSCTGSDQRATWCWGWLAQDAQPDSHAKWRDLAALLVRWVRPNMALRLAYVVPRANGSCVRTQFSWVLCRDPGLLGFRFLNIIISLINIIIFIIVESINIKPIIICVLNIISSIVIKMIIFIPK